MTAAACWEADPSSLPPEIQSALDATHDSDLCGLKLLAAMPEWEVSLPGGATSSQSDVLALAGNDRGLAVLAVEAKVDEDFGPTLGQKRENPSEGQNERLKYLHELLRISKPLGDAIRYQLIHRTASALLTAQAFHANVAVMLIQSFASGGRRRELRHDFGSFSQQLGSIPLSEDIYVVRAFLTPRLVLAWCDSDQSFLDAELPPYRK